MKNRGVNHGIYLCVVTTIFVIFIFVYVAYYATWRYGQFRALDEPALASRNLKPICSFHVLKDIAARHADGFINGNGTWKRSARGVPQYFQPDVCRFFYGTNIPKQNLLHCIRRQKLHYIVLAGDSNSRRYFRSFKKLLSNVGAHCLPPKIITFAKEVTFLPDFVCSFVCLSV